jgi:hypothetical protein
MYRKSPRLEGEATYLHTYSKYFTFHNGLRHYKPSVVQVCRQASSGEQYCTAHNSAPAAILELARVVIGILNKQNTSGQPLIAKKAALAQLDDIVVHLEEHEIEYEKQLEAKKKKR